ncbi:hypothetical protein [Rickettsia asembonensis]|uniref:Uncharacterized protein n=1 Tax=Rickettsia asembonensis TaxID=1068590 RepID=A0A0C2R9B7_9RICK|nr:hypothetical protein [Rickettsia asembonensis]KIJ88783.1 hypothetical protein SB78_03665 [Rickettsia asembonensis]
MYKNVPHSTLKKGYVEFLASKVQSNDVQSVTEWVEESLVNDNPKVDNARKYAFYEAEKIVLSGYIDCGFNEKFDKLLNAIDNEKFDQEFKEHPNYPKLKANECRVLAGAIIESKKALEEDNTMHKKLGDLLSSKYQTLKDINYDVSQIKTIDTALQIVHYETSTLGSTSDSTDY